MCSNVYDCLHPPPVVVVYGIARTTVMRSVTEAVFSSSCMNHVGIVHLKEGEKGEKAIHLKKKQQTTKQFLMLICFFATISFLSFVFLCFFGVSFAHMPIRTWR